MKRALLCAVSLAFACSHAAPPARWNQQQYLLGEIPATDTTTQRPVYAMVRGGGAVIFPSSPQPRVGAAMTGDDQVSFAALRNGSQYGDAFAAGKAEVLWSALSDEARQKRKDLESLRKLVESTLAQLGTETRVRGEYVVSTPRGISYLRDAEYTNAPKGIVLELPFAEGSSTKLAGLAVYRAETRPIAVEIGGEPANAAR